MNDEMRYTVTTRWGTFSLSEDAYYDYLAGKLWISWDPSKRQEAAAPDAQRPANVSDKALSLRDEAAHQGVVETLAKVAPRISIAAPYSRTMSDISIDELSVSVRSGNGLMRAGADTFGKLHRLMETETGLYNIRNLGVKSVKEITNAFLDATYDRQTAYGKAQFWQEVLDAMEKTQ